MEIDIQSLNEFYKSIDKVQNDLKELEKYYVCRYCGKFQKGKYRKLKYCSESCCKKAYYQRTLNKMTPQELQEHRKKERIRIAKYRSSI